MTTDRDTWRLAHDLQEANLTVARTEIEKMRCEDWTDRPDEFTKDIEAAVPASDGFVAADFRRYEIAMDLVHNRNGKYELVDMVNWLLKRVDEERAKHP